MNTDEILLVARELMNENGLQDWRLKWDRAVSRAGLCSFTDRTISLSRPLAEVRSFEETRNTILHEIAHALAGARAGHGPAWKRKAVELGANPERCFQSEAADALREAKSKYFAKCDHCGVEYKVMRRLSNFDRRYCNANECRHRNYHKSTRTYLVWFENTKYGPVKAY